MLPNMTASQIAVAVAHAAAAQRRWAAVPVRDRLRILKRFGQLLCDQKDKVAAVISREAGKPEAEALSTEILVVLDTVKYLNDQAPQFLLPEPVAARQSGDEVEEGHAAARALRRYRNHQPVELSFQRAVGRDAHGTGYGQCRGAQAIGVHAIFVA